MKKFFSLLILCFLSISLAACSLVKSEPVAEDTLTVFDSKDQKVLETTNQDVLDVFSEYIGKSGEDADASTVFGEIPENAVVLYRFEIKDKKGYLVNLYNYSNVDLLLLEDMPVVGDLLLELDKQTANWLRKPTEWEK
ncbi:hypothetical protein ACVR1I_02540 [Streptococcus cameli]